MEDEIELLWQAGQDELQLLWQAWEDENQLMREAGSDEMDLKRAEVENNPTFKDQLNEIEDRMTDLRSAENSLNLLRNEVNLGNMELQEKRFEIEDALDPLYQRLEALHKEEQWVWEQESEINYTTLRENAYQEIQSLHLSLQSQWESEEGAAEVDWNLRDNLRTEAHNKHQATINAIDVRRAEGYDQFAVDDIATDAQSSMTALDCTYQTSKESCQLSIDRANVQINDLGPGSGGEDPRTAYDTPVASYSAANDLFGSTESFLPASESPNPLYESALAERTDLLLGSSIAQATKDLLNQDIGTANSRDVISTAWANSEIALAEKTTVLTATVKLIEDVVQPEWLEAQAAVDAAQLLFSEFLALDIVELSLLELPKTITVPQQVNPAVQILQSEVESLKQLVAQLESSLATNVSAAAPNPELATAYAQKAEYESMLKDLETAYQQKQSELQVKTTSTPSATPAAADDLETQLEQQIEEANRILAETLLEIDNNQLDSGSKSESITTLESQIKTLEANARAVEKEEQLHNRNRELSAKELRNTRRGVEKEIEPLRDVQDELNRAGRPLQRQSMVIEREQMLLQPQWNVLEEERQPIYKAQEEWTELAWKEYQEFEKTAWNEIEEKQMISQRLVEEKQMIGQRLIEDQVNDIRDNAQNELEDAANAIEDEMWALEDQRGDLEDQRGDLEDQRRDIEEQFGDLENAFYTERDLMVKELEGMTDSLLEEKMKPLEDQEKLITASYDEQWALIESLYESQATLVQQISDLEKTVRDLDRQAEFEVLGVITGALTAAEELEQKSGMGSFESFLPNPID